MIANAVRWCAQPRGVYHGYGNYMPREELEGYTGPDFSGHPDDVAAKG